jgi:hypothetical protein
MDSASVQLVDAAEDATWEWYCAHHGVLMGPLKVPLETLGSLLVDLLARIAPGLAPTVTFGFTGPEPDTGENYRWAPETGTVQVDGPAFADELFVFGPLRLLRLATRCIEPAHTYGTSYTQAMASLADVAFNSSVARQLRAAYLGCATETSSPAPTRSRPVA